MIEPEYECHLKMPMTVTMSPVTSRNIDSSAFDVIMRKVYIVARSLTFIYL